jgi:Cu/Zn superoxide dismutase
MEKAMTSKRIAFLSSACCVLALSACNRDDIEPAGNSDDLRKRELPAEVAVRERVKDEERAERVEGAPDSVAAKDETTRNEAAAKGAAAKDEDTVDTNVAPANPTLRRARAELDIVKGGELDAKAVFEERSDGVAVVVSLEDAKPGTRSIRIYDRESCDDIEKKELGKPLATIKDGDLGTIRIGPSGKGTLEATAPSATLKPDDRASLLGKAIVVQEHSDADSRKAGDAIACGVIELNQGLADKAGRMTEPGR